MRAVMVSSPNRLTRAAWAAQSGTTTATAVSTPRLRGPPAITTLGQIRCQRAVLKIQKPGVQNRSPQPSRASASTATLESGAANSTLCQAVGHGYIFQTQAAQRTDIEQAHGGGGVGAGDDQVIGPARANDGHLVVHAEGREPVSAITNGV